MATTTFTPKSDDKFAATTTLVEVATVKPSGYLQGRGIVPAGDGVAMLSAAIQNYYAQEGRPAAVIYTRNVGTSEWVTEAVEVIVPDALPEDFA